MQFFKKVSLKLVLFFLLVIGIDSFMGFLLEPNSYYGYYANYDYKQQKGNFDTIFLGSSWTFFDYNTEVYDALTGSHSFNAGTAVQHYTDSYYYLKQLTAENPIKKVYLNVSHNKLQYPTSGISSAIVWDRLHWNNRLIAALSTGDLNDLKYLLYSYRYPDNLRLSYLSENLSKKLTKEYLSHEADRTAGQYHQSNGYVSGNLKIVSGNNRDFTLTDTHWDEEQIDASALRYLNKIVQLCKEQDITLTLVSVPFSTGYLQATDTNYEDFNAYMNSFAEDNALPYYDFNLLKNSPFGSDMLFQDCSHLNKDGAQIFTNYIANLHSQDTQDMFYSEYPREQIHSYCGGVSLKETGDDSKFVLSASVPEQTSSLLYQFKYKNSGENSYQILQDWSSSNTCILEEKEEDTLYRVEVKHKDSPYIYEAYDALNLPNTANLIEIRYQKEEKEGETQVDIIAKPYPYPVTYEFRQSPDDENYTLV